MWTNTSLDLEVPPSDHRYLLIVVDKSGLLQIPIDGSFFSLNKNSKMYSAAHTLWKTHRYSKLLWDIKG
jgi:hypothetical protein